MPAFLRFGLVAIAAFGLLSACGDDAIDNADADAISTSTTTADATSSTTTAGSTTTADATTSSSTATGESTTTSAVSPTTIVPAASCSAAGLERPAAQPSLPTSVAEQREAILDAALACDIDALAALTGSTFTASFGGDEAAELWHYEEEELGADPLRSLVELLRLTPFTSEDGDETLYIWPTASSYDTWAQVPDSARDELSELYDQDDFAGFESFGGYIGYRAGISDNGTWMFFVIGD